MNVLQYLNKKVKILLKDNFFYTGEIISVNDEGIDIIDIKGQLVSIHPSDIIRIQEIKEETE